MLRHNPADLFDLTTEEALLGNIILETSAVETAAGIVCGADFGDPEHGKLFDAIVSLQRAGVPTADPLALVAELRRMRLPAQMTDGTFIARITHHGARWSERHYATTIRDLAIRRRLIAIGDRLRTAAADITTPAADVARRAQAAIDGVGVRTSTGVTSLGQAAADVVATLRKPKEARSGGASFGIPAVDLMLGRMCAGELWVLAARPGLGKSSLAMQIATHNATKSRRVVVCSLEMTVAELATRAICGDAGIDSRRIRADDLDADDLDALEFAAVDLQGLPVDIWAPPSADSAAIRATALVSAARGDLALVIVDYLSRMTSTEKTSWERVAEQSGALKSLAREIGAPVLALSQFNREAEGGKPSLAMLRYGGSIEQDADAVMALHPADDDENAIELLVLKNRHGAIGMLTLRFGRVATRLIQPDPLAANTR